MKEKFMSDKLEEINITVMKETANALRAFKDNMDLSMGEIVDRLLLNFSTRDINKAAILIVEYLEIVTKDQDSEQVKGTLLQVMAFCLSGILKKDDWEIEDIFNALKKICETLSALDDPKNILK
jgi:hypothetical protein